MLFEDLNCCTVYGVFVVFIRRYFCNKFISKRKVLLDIIVLVVMRWDCAWNWASYGPFAHSPVDMWVNMEQRWGDVDSVNRGTRRDLSLCHFVLHVNCPGSEHKILIGKLEERRQRRRSLYNWEDNYCPDETRKSAILYSYESCVDSVTFRRFKFITQWHSTLKNRRLAFWTNVQMVLWFCLTSIALLLLF